jgi:hypothetical protein
MEYTKFRIEVETVNKGFFTKPITSDVEDIRVFVARTFANTASIPLDQCWKILEQHLYQLALFTHEKPLVIKLNGNNRYFNPANVVSLAIIKE